MIFFFSVQPRVLDLLQAIHIPFSTPGVDFVIGPDGFPAFRLQTEADIKASYRLHLPPTLFRDFTIGVTMKPDDANGFVFAGKSTTLKDITCCQNIFVNTIFRFCFFCLELESRLKGMFTNKHFRKSTAKFLLNFSGLA